MRRTGTILATLALLAMLTLPSLVQAAALPFTPTITMTALTTTTMRIQLAGLRATGIDTIKVYSAVADSATGPKYWFQAATTIDTTVTNLTPGATYIFKVRADSAGTYKVSVPDTAQTYYPQGEPAVAANVQDTWVSASNATAWPRTSTYTYGWTLRTSAARDSSMVYDVWPYTGSTVVVTGDSAKVRLYIYGGFNDSAGTPYFAQVDSLIITAAGTYPKTWSIPVGAKQFYFRWVGDTGCGNNVRTFAYIRRDRH